MAAFGVFLFVLLSVVANTQTISVTGCLNKFAIKLLNETSELAGDSLNFALSTYSIWSLLTLLSEGAKGNTLRELEDVLELPLDRTVLRNNYENLTRLLETRSNDVTLEQNSVIFHDNDFPVKRSFETIARRIYQVPVMAMNFGNPSDTTNVINNYLSRLTKNKVRDFIISEDISFGHLFLINVNDVKGKWKSAFNLSNTKRELFYNEYSQKIGEVDMMSHSGIISYQTFDDIKFQSFELPYGTEEKLSMVVILPFEGERINKLLNSLAKISFSSVLQELETAQKYQNNVAYIHFPKFKHQSDFNLNVVLSKLGIQEIFMESKVDLLGIFDHYVPLERFIQYTTVEVTEEGKNIPTPAGCGCSNSELECCSDKETPAVGPNQKGDSCENSKFECCLEGVTESKGNNFEGCETAPANLQAGCFSPKEKGTCQNFTVQWFFDMDYGGCTRFWYGGCGGNGNRYNSKDECEQICVEPQGTDICKLPKVTGPCKGYYPLWYYDKDQNDCSQFIYGGCLGNNNRFESRKECIGLCVRDNNIDACKQKKEEGPCQGQYQKFY